MTQKPLADLRQDYTRDGLREADAADDPFDQFDRWFAEARATTGHEPNAMTVATVGADGMPTARTLLLKGADRRGYVFFTNYDSPKAEQLQENPRAALLFYWPELERQVRISGPVNKIDRAETERYFRSRPRGNQIGASVARQSQVVTGREALEAEFARFAAAHEDGEIPLPTNWGGYRVTPVEFEFWQGRPSRLHDRLRYRQSGDTWIRERLAP